jgi:glucose/arabinose dehydrogenase
MHRLAVVAVIVSALLPGVGLATAAAQAAATDDVSAVAVTSAVSGVVDIAAPKGDDRLFIVDSDGRVFIHADGVIDPTPFLDIRSRVESSAGEQGLLGLVFAPDYAESGEFYVSYTAEPDGRSRISEFSVSENDPNLADPASEQILVSVAQPATNHNGGDLAFDADGHLLASLGDGGGGGDPWENGQDTTTILGSIIRISRDGEPAPGNPFIDAPGDDRIWAYGLRNPWRIDVDEATGDVWIGDVGQNAWEEVDRIPAGVGGLNFGWDLREGDHCHEPATNCGSAGLTPPVLEYAHGSDPCSGSITGGVMYRGNAIPHLRGHYFYADFCKQFIRSFAFDGAGAVEQMTWTGTFGIGGGITTFGHDGYGEMYLATFSTVYKVVATGGPDCDIDGDGYGDVIVGVPGETVSGVEGAGAVHVFHGSATGLVAAHDDFITQETAGIVGVSRPGDRFGDAVSCADLDGDGYSDVVIGVPGKRIGAREDAGAVTIVPGSAAGVDPGASVRLHQDRNNVRNAAESGDRFGVALATGDFDRNGVPDLAVGVPGERIGGIETGLVHVFMGGGTLLPRKANHVFVQGRNGLPGVRQTGDGFGTALAAGDFDGDGDDDLAVGIPGEPGGGAVQLLKANGNRLVATPQLRGASGVAELGVALASGATNPDGFDDLVAGAPGSDADAGAVVVFLGRPWGLSGSKEVHRQGDGLWNAPQTGDRFGAAVGTARLDDAGLDAVFIGVPGERFGGEATGLVHVLFPGPDGPSRTGDQLVRPGRNLPGNIFDYGNLGSALAAGDHDGDGDEDLVIGDPAGGGQVLVVPSAAGGLQRGATALIDQDSPGVRDLRQPGDEFGGAL